MGEVSATVATIKSNASTLNSRTNDFISTLDAIQTGGVSSLDSLKGMTIDMLKSEWGKIYESIGDFKNNFSTWNEVVTLIAAAHSEFSVDANATYRDTFEGSDTIKMNKERLEALGLLGDGATAAALLKFYNEYGEKGIEGKDGVSSYIRTEKTGPGDNDYTLYVDIKDEYGNLLYTYTTDKDGKVKYFVPTSDGDGNTKLTEVDSQPSLEKNGDTYNSVGTNGKDVVTSEQDSKYTTEKFENENGSYRITIKDENGNIVTQTDYTKNNELSFRREFTDGKVSSAHWYKDGQEIKRNEFSTESDGTEITKYYENDKLVSSSSKNDTYTVYGETKYNEDGTASEITKKYGDNYSVETLRGTTTTTYYKNGKTSEITIEYGDNYSDESLIGATETTYYDSDGTYRVKTKYPSQMYYVSKYEDGNLVSKQLYNGNDLAVYSDENIN